MDFEETDNDNEYKITHEGECEKCGEYSESLFPIDEYLMCPRCEDDYQCPSAISPGLFLDLFQNHSNQDIRVLDYLLDNPNKAFTVKELWQKLNIGEPIDKHEVESSLDSLGMFGSERGMVICTDEGNKFTLNQDEPIVWAIYEFEKVDREESRFDGGYKIRDIESGRMD